MEPHFFLVFRCVIKSYKKAKIICGSQNREMHYTFNNHLISQINLFDMSTGDFSRIVYLIIQDFLPQDCIMLV